MMIIDDLNYLQVNTLDFWYLKFTAPLIQWSWGRASLEVTFFFAAVKSFDANIAIIGIFVLNAKNRNSSQPCIPLIDHR